MKPLRMLLLALVILALTTPVAAQPFTYCGQLSDEDCALMRDGKRSMDELRSVTVISASMLQYPLGSAASAEVTFSAQGKVAILPTAGSVMDFRNLGDLKLWLCLLCPKIEANFFRPYTFSF